MLSSRFRLTALATHILVIIILTCREFFLTTFMLQAAAAVSASVVEPTQESVLAAIAELQAKFASLDSMKATMVSLETAVRGLRMTK